MTEPKYIDAVKIHKDLTRTIIDDINNPTKNTVFDFGWRQGVQYAAFVIENEPAADVQPVRRGTWEETEHAPDGLLYATCSVCGKRQVIEVANYCPMCGANLSKEEDE